MSDHADTINPSGKRAIDEMREFAAALPERIGPFFGRDVVRMLDSMEAENQQLRDALEQTLERLVNVDGNLALTNYDAQVMIRAALAAVREEDER